MGLCYTIIMQDDFDWKYSGYSKESRLGEFEHNFRHGTEVDIVKIGSWHGHAVYDLDKLTPYSKEAKSIIMSYCDSCVYYNDSEPYKKEMLF